MHMGCGYGSAKDTIIHDMIIWCSVRVYGEEDA